MDFGNELLKDLKILLENYGIDNMENVEGVQVFVDNLMIKTQQAAVDKLSGEIYNNIIGSGFKFQDTIKENIDEFLIKTIVLEESVDLNLLKDIIVPEKSKKVEKEIVVNNNLDEYEDEEEEEFVL